MHHPCFLLEPCLQAVLEAHVMPLLTTRALINLGSTCKDLHQLVETAGLLVWQQLMISELPAGIAAIECDMAQARNRLIRYNKTVQNIGDRRLFALHVLPALAMKDPVLHFSPDGSHLLVASCEIDDDAVIAVYHCGSSRWVDAVEVSLYCGQPLQLDVGWRDRSHFCVIICEQYGGHVSTSCKIFELQSHIDTLKLLHVADNQLECEWQEGVRLTPSCEYVCSVQYVANQLWLIVMSVPKLTKELCLLLKDGVDRNDCNYDSGSRRLDVSSTGFEVVVTHIDSGRNVVSVFDLRSGSARQLSCTGVQGVAWIGHVIICATGYEYMVFDSREQADCFRRFAADFTTPPFTLDVSLDLSRTEVSHLAFLLANADLLESFMLYACRYEFSCSSVCCTGDVCLRASPRSPDGLFKVRKMSDSLQMVKLDDVEERHVYDIWKIPEKSEIANVQWSPCGTYVAFTEGTDVIDMFEVIRIVDLSLIKDI